MHSLAESRKKKLRTDNVRHIFTGLSGGLDPAVPPADISSATPPRTFTTELGGGVADGGRGEEETGGGGEKTEEGGYLGGGDEDGMQHL